MSSSSRRGAYGFRFVLPGRSADLPGLIEQPDTAPELRVETALGSTTESRWEIDEGCAHLAAADHLTLEVRRSPAWFRITLPRAPAPEALIHPVATVPSAILSRWRGDVVLHAGAFVHDGGAWVLGGTRGVGKSSTLALLARRGLPIAADDLVVVTAGDVLAGPACVDLREDTAPDFPSARWIGNVGGRERFRLTTAAAPARLPLRGVFLLEWGDGPVDGSPLALAQRAAAVHTLDYAPGMPQPDPGNLVDLLTMPMWRLSRPRSWESGEAAVDRLLELAAGH